MVGRFPRVRWAITWGIALGIAAASAAQEARPRTAATVAIGADTEDQLTAAAQGIEYPDETSASPVRTPLLFRNRPGVRLIPFRKSAVSYASQPEVVDAPASASRVPAGKDAGFPPQPLPTTLPGEVPGGTPGPGAAHAAAEDLWTGYGASGTGSAASRLWFRGEFLLWWTKSVDMPVLATTASPGTALGQAGALGQANTSVLFGGDSMNFGDTPGARLTLGMWFDAAHDSGCEATWLGLGMKSLDFQTASDASGNPILARPYFNLQTGLPDRLLVSAPGANPLTGGISVRETSELQGVEVLTRLALARDADARSDVLIGYRFLRLSDDLRVASYSIQAPALLGTTVADHFATNNEFQGLELGLSRSMTGDRWSLELTGKTAFGNTESRTTIGGTTTAPTGAVSGTGLLAQSSNSNFYDANQFSVIPELDATLGLDLTPRLRATVGYTLVYWSRVARAGDEVDLQIDPRQMGGASSPIYAAVGNDFWAQGVNVGFDYHF